MKLAEGAVIASRYLIGPALGEGGLGTAHRARDLLFEAEIALKIVRDVLPDGIEALRREFLTLRGLTHPHLVRVRDFGVHRDQDGHPHPFYTADLVDGVDLLRHVKGQSFSDIKQAVSDTMGALAFLHERGVVHGDVKPENVRVSPGGRGTLLDLSCCRRVGSASGTALGTPGFMAPEILRGVVDPRSDLYALGKTLRALAGAISGALPPAILRQIQRLSAEDMRERPSSVEEVLEAMKLARDTRPKKVLLPSGLFGRERELSVCRDLVDALLEGRSGVRVAHFYGPPGVGRTRMLQQAKWEAQMRAEVVEGLASGAGTVLSMLARALGVATPSGEPAVAVTALVEKLRARAVPTLLCIDDEHLLDRGERELLRVLARSLGDDGCVGLLSAGREALSLKRGESVLDIELEPLPLSDVRVWLGEVLSPSAIAVLMERTAGLPRDVCALLGSLSYGETSPESIRRAGARMSTTGAGLSPSEELSNEERGSLCVLVALGGRASGLGPEAEVLSLTALDALAARGVIRREGAEYRFAPGEQAEAIGQSVGVEGVREAHRALAACFERRLKGELSEPRGLSEPREQRPPDVRRGLRAKAATHLAAAGDASRARAIIDVDFEDALRNPHLFHRAFELLLESGDADPALALSAARVFEGCGEPVRALSVITRALALRALEPWRGQLRRAAARCYLKRGDTRRAARRLSRVLETALAPEERADVAADLSLAKLMLGDYAEAARIAEGGLAAAPWSRARCDLACNIALAKSYLGDARAAEEALRGANAKGGIEEVGAPSPRSLFRLRSTEAFVAHRSGRAEDAARAYRAALSVAEEHSIADRLATAALNYGTANHQLGDLGPALAAYERGFRMATALGITNTEVMLEYNLARVFADIGLFERAESKAELARERARGMSMKFMVAATSQLQAEVSFFLGRPAECRRYLDEARAELKGERAERELVELGLEETELDIAVADLDPAEARISALVARAHDLGASDLCAQGHLLRAQLLSLRGQSAEALTDLDIAKSLASAAGRRLFLANVEGALAEAHARAGAVFLARRHKIAQRELLERTLATLPPAFHDAFRAHPKRAAAFREPDSAGEHDPKTARELEHLRRLLEINRRLNAAITSEEVLLATMDAAIDLARAERGFVLLVQREPGDERITFRIPVARNLDREKIGRAQLKFSRTIAERAIRSGEPQVTIDAENDPRFKRNASVHAMHLKSVVCVPIRTGKEALGALYLDNRFRIGGFNEPDIGMLLALADQAALALTKARLHDELARRTVELEAMRKEVERHLLEQAEEIRRLKTKQPGERPSPTHRFDYSEIVGKSPAMTRVFDVLDRVTFADVTILIRGESGTGKELIARAVHKNSGRSAGPFLAINCGALPEGLLEAELFGYRRGSFTGATRDHDGLFVLAGGGTLFLDELGEMPSSMQVKLLRVLQERRVRALGANEDSPVDVRLVCATNRILKDEVREGRFREDLYYRVAVVEIELPALRDRIEDIPPLADAILSRIAVQSKREKVHLDRSAERALMSYSWPGNVRQLENVLTRGCLLCDGTVLRASDLGLSTIDKEARARRGYKPVEATRIRATLRANGWNVADAARALSIPRATFYRKLKRYGISCEDDGEATGR